MKCPECDREMTRKDSAITRSRGGKSYDWTKFVCTYNDVWVEQWIPHEEEK